MKTSSTIYSGILIASFAVSGLGQQPTRDQGTVDADRDRAGKTGHIGDGDRGGSGKTRDVGYLFGAFDHGQLDLDKDGRISKNEYDQAFKRMDTDRDGYLSSQEFRQAGSRSMKSGGDPSSNRAQSSDPRRKSDPTPKTTP
jgi:EF hand